uniref:Uncharacterized protein n=1 Tax=Microplitis mediator bracovirus TaxID=1836595 RepID=A0A2I6SGV3_9VIRU|nr:hypothetical protein MmBV_CLP1 [Microplitis mediator bracovirus]
MIAQPPELRPYSVFCTPMSKSEFSRITMIVIMMTVMIVFIMGAAFISLLMQNTSHLSSKVVLKFRWKC